MFCLECFSGVLWKDKGTSLSDAGVACTSIFTGAVECAVVKYLNVPDVFVFLGSIYCVYVWF